MGIICYAHVFPDGGQLLTEEETTPDLLADRILDYFSTVQIDYYVPEDNDTARAVRILKID